MAMGKDTHVAELGLERAAECVHERTSFATKTGVEVESAAEGLRAAGAGAGLVPHRVSHLTGGVSWFDPRPGGRRHV